MELRISALLVAGALVVLLLFGCLGGIKQTQPQGSGQPAASQPTTPPSQQQSGGSIGDADISGSQSEDETELPGEDLVPPPVDDAPSGLALDDSDIDLGVIEDDLVISEEDIVEPA